MKQGLKICFKIFVVSPACWTEFTHWTQDTKDIVQQNNVKSLIQEWRLDKECLPLNFVWFFKQ